MATKISMLDSLQCAFVIPDSNKEPSEILSRWSDTNINRPALIITPETEQDVQASIRVAKANNLTILAAGGGHGTFVPVDSSTLYLDMCKFKMMELNEDDRTVRLGGGVLSGELLQFLTAKGYYTPIPNSNPVGVVGCVIGGGNTAMSGLHGWMADIVISFRLVTAQGDIIEVSSSSEGKELALFNTLCGAGHGLSVITSITTSVFPISSLNMTEDKFWLRSLVFPASALGMAAKTFMDLSQPSPAAINILTFARSPPGTPMPGTPIIIVGSTFFGPAKMAEREAAVLFQEDAVAKALNATTDMIPMSSLNDRYKAFESHGGHKVIASCRLTNIDLDAIQTAFDQWQSVTDKYPDAQRSALIISCQNSSKHQDLGQSKVGAAKFIEGRDRGVIAMVVSICKEQDTAAAMAGFITGLFSECRKGETVAPRSFPNNLRFGGALQEMFDEQRLIELRDLKQVWDSDGVFWSPYEV